MAEEESTSPQDPPATPQDPPVPPQDPPATPLDSRISPADSLAYWNRVTPTVSGMLGGYPQVSRIDLRASLSFLTKLRKRSSSSSSSSPPPQSPTTQPPFFFNRAVDCGAGIGRITAGLLSKVCATIDVVEPVRKFAMEVMSNAEFQGNGLVGEIYVTGLEDWKPHDGVRYDLVWNQWALGHLTDAQLVAHLRRCGALLGEGGWIVVKENLSTQLGGGDAFDVVDSSVTRSDASFRGIFAEAGLEVGRTEVQGGFPRELLPVRTYALRPVGRRV